MELVTKSLVCLLVLFVSFLSYGENAKPLSQSVEEQIATNETPLETKQTVLDYDSILSVKVGLNGIASMWDQTVLMPFSLEYQTSIFIENMKGIVSTGVAIGVINSIGVINYSEERLVGLPVNLGLRYDFRLLTFGFDMGSVFFGNGGFFDNDGFLPLLELSLGVKFLKEAHAKLGVGAIPGATISGSFSVSYPLNKW